MRNRGLDRCPETLDGGSTEGQAIVLGENRMREEATAVLDRPQVTHYQVERVTPRENKAYSFAKRGLDLILAVFLLILLMVPMAILAVLVRLDSPGPAFFRQERLGRDGRPFMIYKFRTMVQDAERDGPQWAKEGDRRCTKLGRFLRKSRIDEIPQVWNVIRGEMSFVGPRPERAYFYKEFASYIDGFDQRLQVTPGITGWAQVNGGYTLPPEEKILYDVEYMKNRSLGFDLKCIAKTFEVVVKHKGAR